MSSFEYVSVLISIILGLGITQLITGISTIVHHGEKVKTYWPHLLWVGFIFFLHLQEWWVTFELRDNELWDIRFFIILISYPIVLFILARLLFSDDATDYRIFYFENYKKIFKWSIVLNILTMIDNMYNNYPIHYYILPAVIMTIFSTILIKGYRSELLHKVIVSILFVVLIVILLSNDMVLGKR